MSIVPGFSVSDLISAVTWTIEFIIALKSVRGEVEDLRKSLEKASSELCGLEDLLKERQNRIEGPIQFRTAALNALRTDLHGILNDIFSLLNRFDPQGGSKSVLFSTFRQNVRWVADSRYSGTVKDLLRRLSEYRQSVNTELLFCIHYHQISKEPRRESVPAAPVSAQPTVPLSAFDKETGSSSSQVPVAPVTTAKHPVISCPTPLPPTRVNQSHPWQHVNAPPSPPPSPPARLTRSQTRSIANASSTSTETPPLQITRALTLPPYTSSQLVPEMLRTTGDVKVWFQYENSRDPENAVSVPHRIKTITILRDRSGNFRGVYSTRFDDAVLKHELPDDKFFLNFFKHPFPVHSRQVRDIKEGRFQASNCVSFLRERRDPTNMIPDYYSFSAVEDYRLFQNKVVGGFLMFWFEVKSIYSEWGKPTPVCESQILQLWEIGGVRKIHFFRNGKDRQYSQHSVLSLRVDKKSLKKAQKEGLKLVFERNRGSPPLSPEELKMEYLSIVFTNPKEIGPFLEGSGFF